MVPHFSFIPAIFLSILFFVISSMTLTFAQEIPGRELPGPPIQELNLGSNVMKAKLWKGVVDKIGEAIDAEEIDEALLKAHKDGDRFDPREKGYFRNIRKSDLREDFKNLTKLQLKILASKMTVPVKRAQHPKDHACVAATFKISDNLPDEYKTPLLIPGKEYDSVIRFSNARSGNDTATNVQGMAIKLFGIHEDKILKNEKDALTQDFLLADSPEFFAKNAQRMLMLMNARVELAKGNSNPSKEIVKSVGTEDQEAITQGFNRILKELEGLARKALKHQTQSPLSTQYWSQTPYKLNDTYVKYSVKPTSQDVDAVLSTNIWEHFRRQEIMKHLKNGNTATFDFMIQDLDTNKNDNPLLHDPTMEWKTADVPFETIATITIPPQSFNSLENRKFCENLSFTPWHSLPEHQPYGEINLARKFVYLASSAFRRIANGTSRHEPTGKELVVLGSDPDKANQEDNSEARVKHHECTPLKEFEPRKGKEVVWLDQYDVKMREEAIKKEIEKAEKQGAKLDANKAREIVIKQEIEARHALYHRSQGAELIPYAWWLHLEQPLRDKLFRSEDNLCMYKVIPHIGYPVTPDPDNHPEIKDHLPIGFAYYKDDLHTLTHNWLGFTCAACHTGQLEFGNKKIIIDGGQAMWDIRNFVKHMYQALFVTLEDEKKFSRFAKNVIKENEDRNWDREDSYDSKDLLPLKKAHLRAQVSTFLGKAFLEKSADDKQHVFPLTWGFGRLDALGRGSNNALREFAPTNVRPANAPASYPKLWDAWKYDWVQWGASISQPLARNIAQVLGVGTRITPIFGDKTAFEEGRIRPIKDSKECLKNVNWIDGSGEIDEKCKGLVETSIDLKGLVKLEKDYLRKISPPKWPTDIFGSIDERTRAEGEGLYLLYCMRCHIPRNLREVMKGNDAYTVSEKFELQEIPINKVGTDATYAYNFYARRVDLPIFGIQNIAARTAIKTLTDYTIETLSPSLPK